MSSENITRIDGRRFDQLRPLKITRNFVNQAEGSVLIECGRTMVLCNASFSPGVPRWRADSGLGWVTAEYAMLPRATATRTAREATRGKVGGRTHEISRLIGRSLRAVVDYAALGENTITLDCDVLSADGGTRTTSITGAYLALAEAIRYGQEAGLIGKKPVLLDSVSATSVGYVNGNLCLDLPYVEDSNADVDMNIVQTGTGNFVEVQGTAEGAAFNPEQLQAMLSLATKGNNQLAAAQAEFLSHPEKSVFTF